MSEALVDAMPPGGWTADDLDDLPVGNIRYELTDGAPTERVSTLSGGHLPRRPAPSMGALGVNRAAA